MTEVERFKVLMGWSEGGDQDCVKASDYDALAAQRDEGLAREAELRADCEANRHEREVVCANYDALQQRLAEAEKILQRWGEMFQGGLPSSALGVLRIENAAFLASPGCADGEKAS